MFGKIEEKVLHIKIKKKFDINIFPETSSFLVEF